MGGKEKEKERKEKRKREKEMRRLNSREISHNPLGVKTMKHQSVFDRTSCRQSQI